MSEVKKVNLRFINSKLENDYDVFICCSSFEERCLTIPQKIENKHFSQIIIFENSIGSALIKNNSQKLKGLFAHNQTVVSVDFSNTLSFADQLARQISMIQGRKLKVLIDVTTFTHETLLICLKVLKLTKKVDELTCVYVNATEYCPGQEVDKKWLSQGCKNVHSILGYPGMLFPSLKTHLIVIVVYEYNRAFDTISTIEPNSVSLVYGSANDSITDKDKEANSTYNDLVLQMAFEYKNIETVEMPCDNPNLVAEGLSKIISDHENDSIVIVPMNNKMSTVGVALSAFQNEHVQVCYAPAVLYNEENYSSPGEYCYFIKIK